MAASVDLQSVLVRSSELVHSEVDGEITMMNVETGRYYGLSSTVAADIWRLLQQPVKAQQICEQLVSEYRVEPDRCEREVLAFLQRLSDEGVIATT